MSSCLSGGRRPSAAAQALLASLIDVKVPFWGGGVGGRHPAAQKTRGLRFPGKGRGSEDGTVRGCGCHSA